MTFETIITLPQIMPRFPLPEIDRDIADYEPVFVPSFPETRNKRKSKCGQCERPLSPGEGVRWEYADRAKGQMGYASSPYYCPGCNRYGLDYLQIAPDIAHYEAIIQDWLKEYTGSMWHQAYTLITNLINGCELDGADVAEAIVDRLPMIKDPGYVAVVRLAREVASQIVGPVDGVA